MAGSREEFNKWAGIGRVDVSHSTFDAESAWQGWQACESELSALRTLVKVVLPFTYHKGNCAVEIAFGGAVPCDCGFVEAMAALEKALEVSK